MASIGWLHLTDLHHGLQGQASLWPAVREVFFDDLALLHERSGPWDLVLFTGDLTQRGSEAEFQGLSELLGRLWEHFGKLGSRPLLLATPGNHDLVRPKPGAVVKALRTWHDDREIQESFFGDAASEYRSTVTQAFAPFVAWSEAWSAAHPPPAGLTVERRAGLLPGDFAVTVEKDGASLGVVSLNSAFLQLTGDNYEGRLHLDPRQLHAACGGDGPDWIKRHQVNLLLTHHPPEWLHPGALAQFRSDIAPPGWFEAHLFGHMHEPTASFLQMGGSATQRRFQGASLFGLETWGDGAHERIHGYGAGRLSLDEGRASIQAWPRIAARMKAGFLKLVPDQSFDLDPQGAYRTAIEVRSIAARRAAPPASTGAAASVPSGSSLQNPGGAYDPRWYVSRAGPEREALQCLQQPGQPVAIWGPELFGKTWLLKHLVARTLEKNPEARVAALDMRLLGSDSLSALGDFLDEFAVQVVDTLGLDPELVKVAARRPGSPLRRLTWLFEKHVLPASPHTLVLALDQIDKIWQRPWSDDFFGLLRGWSESAMAAPWSRLRLLVAMSTTPALLTGTVVQSPFANVAYEIRLLDLTAEQIQALAALHGLSWSDDEVERLMEFVGGHPFLTRLAMVTAAREKQPIARLLGDDHPVFEPFLDRLRWRLAKGPKLLEALAAIRRGQVVSDGEALLRLQRAGIIDDPEGVYGLRYRLYERLVEGR